MITKGSKETPSAEIIITIPRDKGGKNIELTLGWWILGLQVPYLIKTLWSSLLRHKEVQKYTMGKSGWDL
jgi:hypothetical protein